MIPMQVQPPAVTYACQNFMWGPLVPGWKGAKPGGIDTLKPLIGQPKNVVVAATKTQFPRQLVFVEVAGKCRGFVGKAPTDSGWRVVQYMPGGTCGGVEFDLSRLGSWDKRGYPMQASRNTAVKYLWSHPPVHYWTAAEMPCAFQ